MTQEPMNTTITDSTPINSHSSEPLGKARPAYGANFDFVYCVSETSGTGGTIASLRGLVLFLIITTRIIATPIIILQVIMNNHNKQLLLLLVLLLLTAVTTVILPWPTSEPLLKVELLAYLLQFI